MELKSRKAQNRVLMVGALVLVAGGIAAAIAYGTSGSGSKNALPQAHAGKPKVTGSVPKTVKLDQAAVKVARKFLATDVLRKNLRDGYAIVGPDLKEGMTLREWLTGEIPVVPYPGDAVDKIPIQITYSYANEAMLRVFILPRKGSKVKPAAFFLRLNRVGKGARAQWLVTSWVPTAFAPVQSVREG